MHKAQSGRTACGRPSSSPSSPPLHRGRAGRGCAPWTVALRQGDTCFPGDPASPSTCPLANYLVTSLQTELSLFLGFQLTLLPRGPASLGTGLQKAPETQEPDSQEGKRGPQLSAPVWPAAAFHHTGSTPEPLSPGRAAKTRTQAPATPAAGPPKGHRGCACRPQVRTWLLDWDLKGLHWTGQPCSPCTRGPQGSPQRQRAGEAEGPQCLSPARPSCLHTQAISHSVLGLEYNRMVKWGTKKTSGQWR